MSKKSIWFIILVLLFSWIITFAVRLGNLGQNPMVVVMAFPMLLALIFILAAKNEKLSSVGWRFPELKYFLLSILLPVFQLVLVVGLGWAFRLLSVNSQHFLFHKPSPSIWFNLVICIPAMFVPFILLPLPNLLLGWLNHLGEEFAWRGYLFRKVSLESQSIVKGVVVSGGVWWAWHLPLFWLSPVLAELDALRLGFTVLLSLLSMVGTAFVYSWIYIKSRSIWAPVIMHLFWNLYRGILTGRLSDAEPGIFRGDLWLINGEGVIGMCVTIVFGLFFFIVVRKIEISKEWPPVLSG